MKIYSIQLEPLTVKARSVAHAKELALEYFKNEVTEVTDEEVTEVEGAEGGYILP